MRSDGLPRVLVDATPLCTGSGLRGIGRFVRDLLYGLAGSRGEWGDELDIRAIFDLRLSGRWAVSDDLIAAADRAFEMRGSRASGLIQARRWVLGTAARAEQASLLHVTEALGTPLIRAVRKVVTCHDLIPLRYPKEYLGGRMRGRMRWVRDSVRYRTADQVVCISQRTALDLQELIGVPASRIDVVHNGIDLMRWMEPGDPGTDRRLLEQLGIAGKTYLVYAGYSDWRKNVPTMLEALALARRTADVHLVWAGHLAPKQLARVRALERSAGVQDAVLHVGFVEEQGLPILFRNAVAHLFLSRLEGFGLSIPEAMSVGCPAIVARSSGADEIAGEAAVVLDADDAPGAAQAIVRFTLDPIERQRFAQAGRQRALRFERKRMALEYASIYSRLLRDPPARAGNTSGTPE